MLHGNLLPRPADGDAQQFSCDSDLAIKWSLYDDRYATHGFTLFVELYVPVMGGDDPVLEVAMALLPFQIPCRREQVDGIFNVPNWSKRTTHNPID